MSNTKLIQPRDSFDRTDATELPVHVDGDELTFGYRFEGRYEIEAWWHGGMATVYKVRDIRTGNIYAAKRPRASAALDSVAIQQIHDEAQVWLKMPLSQHIVPVLYVGIDRGCPYLLMEFMPGGTLADRLRTPGIPLPYEEAIDFAFQVCVGMRDANAVGELAHLDLKPSNLLLTTDGVLKISDFGVAHRTSLFDNQQIRTMAGTPIYMSPEQLLDEVVSVRSDVFSFGVMFFQMLTGRLPYPMQFSKDNAIDKTRLALLHRLLRKEQAPTRQEAIDHQIDYDAVTETLANPYLDTYYALSNYAKKQVDRTTGEIIARCLPGISYERAPTFQYLLQLFEDFFPQARRRVAQQTARALTADEWYLKGQSYQNIGEDEQALTCFNRALKVNLKRDDIYLSAAKSYLNLGRISQAETMIRRAHYIVPHDPVIAKLMAQIDNPDDA